MGFFDNDDMIDVQIENVVETLNDEIAVIHDNIRMECDLKQSLIKYFTLKPDDIPSIISSGGTINVSGQYEIVVRLRNGTVAIIEPTWNLYFCDEGSDLRECYAQFSSKIWYLNASSWYSSGKSITTRDWDIVEILDVYETPLYVNGNVIRGGYDYKRN